MERTATANLKYVAGVFKEENYDNCVYIFYSKTRFEITSEFWIFRRLFESEVSSQIRVHA
jgi:hypothetical protein